MTILYALLVPLVTMLATTITSLYDLNYIVIHLTSLSGRLQFSQFEIAIQRCEG